MQRSFKLNKILVIKRFMLYKRMCLRFKPFIWSILVQIITRIVTLNLNALVFYGLINFQIIWMFFTEEILNTLSVVHINLPLSYWTHVRQFSWFRLKGSPCEIGCEQVLIVLVYQVTFLLVEIDTEFDSYLNVSRMTSATPKPSVKPTIVVWHKCPDREFRRICVRFEWSAFRLTLCHTVRSAPAVKSLGNVQQLTLESGAVLLFAWNISDICSRISRAKRQQKTRD